MKTKTKLIYSCLGVLLMASCQQTNELSEAAGSVSVTREMKELDLANASYAEIKSLLSGREKIENVLLKDGEFSKSIAILAQDKSIDSNDSENDMKDFFYYGAPEDSTYIILNNAYASVNLQSNGDQIGYVIYADPSKNQKLIETYNNELPATRSADGEPITRSTSAYAPVRINLTEGSKLMKRDGELCKTLPSEQVDNADSDASPAPTRTAYYTQWPRGNTLTIHLVRDQSDMPWEHEIGWQIEDLKSSLLDIRGDLNIKVWRSNTGFGSSNDAYNALREFRRHCESPNFPWKEAAGHDIMMLIRHWGWNNVNGAAATYVYDIKRYENKEAYGVSCTNAWNNKTLAHEVGHILGAFHAEWGFSHWIGWTLYLGYDLMVPTHNWFRWSRHFDHGNRRRIYERLH